MSKKEGQEKAYEFLLEKNTIALQEEFNRFNLLTLRISIFPGSGTDTVSFEQAFKVIKDLYDTMNRLKEEGKISPEAYTQLLNQIIR